MPLYEYQCKKCRHRFEKIHQSFSDPPVKKCPECGGPVEKLLSAPAVQFKGTGWYATDYAKKSSPSATSSDGSGSDSSSKSAESGEGSKSADSGSKSEKGDSKESKSDSKSKPESSSKKSHKK